MKLINESLFEQKDVVGVGLSGGSDSMALLHFLFNNAKKLNIKVLAINIEHGIRGEESKSDSAFVKNYCEKMSIELLTFSFDCLTFCKEEKLSLEEGARILRYGAFEECINSGKCTKIAIGQHQGDNCETILFNLLRGSSLKGACGILEQVKNIVRPMLNTPKSEILAYLKENSIPFVNDSTNEQTTYTRNFLRHKIISPLKEVFPKMEDSLVRFAQSCKTDDDYLTSLACKIVTYKNGTAFIKLEKELAIFSRAVVVALKELNVKKDYTNKNILDVHSLIDKKNGKEICLINGVVATRQYDCIALYKKQNHTPFQLPFEIGKFKLMSGLLTVEKVEKGEELNFELFQYLDADKLPLNCVIKTKEDGDIFHKFNGQTKKLKDFLIDKKVPQATRGNIPLVAKGKNVYLIAKIETSGKIRVDKSSTNVLKLKYTQIGETNE